MCFSANASFTSAALLVTVGTITALGNRSKPHRMIAIVPLLFGLQQAAEGVVWQTMGQEDTVHLHQFAVLVFLGFALVVWPSWIPWSIFKIEKDIRRKKILKIIGLIGFCVSLASAWVLLTTDVKAYITGHSLAYTLSSIITTQQNWAPNLEFLLYTTATMLPFFISSLKTVKIAGCLVAISLVLSHIINKEASSSIWCFFAALISLYIAVNVLWLQKGKIT